MRKVKRMTLSQIKKFLSEKENKEFSIEIDFSEVNTDEKKGED